MITGGGRRNLCRTRAPHPRLAATVPRSALASRPKSRLRIGLPLSCVRARFETSVSCYVGGLGRKAQSSLVLRSPLTAGSPHPTFQIKPGTVTFQERLCPDQISGRHHDRVAHGVARPGIARITPRKTRGGLVAG